VRPFAGHPKSPKLAHEAIAAHNRFSFWSESPVQARPTWIWQQPDWPGFRWDQARLAPLLARARLGQGKVLGAARLLDTDLTREAVAAILVEDGVTTSAIEGERLDPAAVRSSVARRLGLPTAGLPAPSRAVDGLIDVLLDATRHHNRPLTLERLCGWQAALFPTGYSGLHAIRAGALRGDAPMQVVSGAIDKERVHFVAPPRDGLDAELAACLAWISEPPASVDGLLRAGIAHLWFITLHPFEDGNGRLARALTDMLLCRDEAQPMRLFSLSAQILREREAYYAILEQTQRDGCGRDRLARLVPATGGGRGEPSRADRRHHPGQGALLATTPSHRPQRAPAQGAQPAARRRPRRLRGRHQHPQVHGPHQHQPRHRLPRAGRSGRQGLPAARRQGRQEQCV
jgi:Fic family protein